MENHHRNNRKHVGNFHGRFGTPNGSASPAPSLRKGHSIDRHQTDIRNSLDRRSHAHGSPNGHRKISSEDRERIRERQAQQPRPGHQRVSSSPMANGANGKPLSEHDRKLQHVLAPINEHLAKAHGAQKKKIPDDMTRLKIIKVSLVAIGNHIFNHPNIKDNSSLEASLWDFVSDRHWPQSTKESKRVSGKKLRDMYIKIAGKDAAPKTTSRPSASNGSSGDIKKEPSPVEEKKPIAMSPPPTVKAEDKMDVDSKSPA